jgi:hypothetical protein
MRGLSCVRGNSHAQFLGGLGLATAPGYPTIRPGEQKRLDKGVKKAGSRHNTNGLNGQRLKLYA